MKQVHLQPHLAVIGMGKLGTAITQSYLHRGMNPTSPIAKLLLYSRSPEKLEKDLLNQIKLHPQQINLLQFLATDAALLLLQSSYWILAVKPAQLHDFATLHPTLKNFTGIIYSTLAGTPLAVLKSYFPKAQMARIMLNLAVSQTPAPWSYFSGAALSSESLAVLDFIGKSWPLPSEEQFELISLLFGSMPALLSYLLQPLKNLLITAETSSALEANLAQQIIYELVHSSLELLRDADWNELVKKVQTPGGITQKALAYWDEQELPATLTEAFHQAALQSKNMAQTIHQPTNR